MHYVLQYVHGEVIKKFVFGAYKIKKLIIYNLIEILTIFSFIFIYYFTKM
ncbi:hypothetical protein TH70_2118 [Streptococcus agalactiae]|nr:hypothetical protein TH70_2118 [Streptococcus agalactiae]